MADETREALGYRVEYEGRHADSPPPFGSGVSTYLEDASRIDAQVQAALDFVRTTGQAIGRIGPPEQALDAEQMAAYVDDKAYRARLVESSGGPVSVFEGIIVSEAEDASVKAWVIDYEFRQRSARAMEALGVYEGSWEVRAGYRLYSWRLRARATALRFWVWLRKTEPR